MEIKNSAVCDCGIPFVYFEEEEEESHIDSNYI